MAKQKRGEILDPEDYETIMRTSGFEGSRLIFHRTPRNDCISSRALNILKNANTIINSRYHGKTTNSLIGRIFLEFIDKN